MSSLAAYFHQNDGSSCGYCHQGSTSISHGMYTPFQTVKCYMNLIDRGWRRSGTYCYKPTMHRTCCPAYTIRCDAVNYVLTKSQKKNIKKFNKFATDGGTTETMDKDQPDTTPSKSETTNKTKPTPQKNPNKVSGPDPNKAACKKAKQLRIERREEKLKSKGIDPATIAKPSVQNREKTLEELLNELPSDSKLKLRIELVRSSKTDSRYKRSADNEFNLYQKYQMAVHNDAPEECSRRQFERFLVESPLKFETINGVECGSFHQQLWLGDDLIGVGVIDILPNCVSSVYFFYHPDFMNLTLGTYGALREIALVRQLNTRNSNIRYYYMGFYIHSCPKMSYKGNYQPSYLLCPETYDWFPFKEAIEKITASKYSRLNPDRNAIDNDEFNPDNIGNLRVLTDNLDTVMLYNDYKNMRQQGSNVFPLIREDVLKTYAKFVGRTNVQNLALFF